ncbi:MAG: pentapeptide repeat-containing protein [Cyanobacteria bacterium J06638_20]
MENHSPFTAAEQHVSQLSTGKLVSLTVGVLLAIALWVEPGLNWRSPRAIARVLFESLDTVAIAVAVLLYAKHRPDNKAQKHWEAWQAIDQAAATPLTLHYSRNQALQRLAEDDVSLAGIRLPEADLAGLSLEGAHLSGANLSGANLREISFHQSNLSGANLSGANLSDANLTKASFSGANLNGANLSYADMGDAKLNHANLSFSNLYSARLSEANLSHANLNEATLNDARLIGTDLSFADLSGANLTNTNLSFTNLCRTNLQWAKGITQSQLEKSKLCQTVLPNGIDLDCDRDCKELQHRYPWISEELAEPQDQLTMPTKDFELKGKI